MADNENYCADCGADQEPTDAEIEAARRATDDHFRRGAGPMSPDDFTEAARAEILSRLGHEAQRSDGGKRVTAFVGGAEWGREQALAAQKPTGLDDPETYRKIAAEIEWHIRTASARGYARAKGTDLPDGVIDAQIESAVRAITTITARAAQRDEEKR